jgi:hypothetical protein
MGALLTVFSVISLLTALSKSSVAQPKASAPIVGAIRWDAWYGDRPAGQVSPIPREQVEKTLAPPKYHFRLPFFAHVDADGTVSINGDSQATMDQEITYARRAGLDYWAFVDYWSDPTLTIAFKRYTAAKEKKGIRFCFIEEGGRLDGQGLDGWTSTAIPRLVAEFADPNYQRVLGDRPLLFVFGPPKIIGKSQFDALSQAAIAAGLQRPYYVLMGFHPVQDNDDAQALGFDAVSSYAKGAGYVWDQWAYSDLTKAVQSSYWDTCRDNHISTVTFVSTGWDPRPRLENPVTWIHVTPHPDPTPPAQQQPLIDGATASPDQIAAHLKAAIQWTKQNRDIDPANAIIVYAWNENDEGGWLIPTLGPNGKPDTGRIDALAHVLAAK